MRLVYVLCKLLVAILWAKIEIDWLKNIQGIIKKNFCCLEASETKVMNKIKQYIVLAHLKAWKDDFCNGGCG